MRRFGISCTAGLLLLLIAGSTSGADTERLTASSAFTEQACRHLPVELPYAYHRRLSSGPVHRPGRDAAARPSKRELALPAAGWRLLIGPDAGPVLQTAARDFQDYLQVAMQVRVLIERRKTLKGFEQLERVLVVGTRQQLATAAGKLTGPKDYRLQVMPGRIVVCGYDESGAMFGLYNLEARMNLREGPFLPRALDTVRRSLYRTRMALSWLGWMEWPDAYLSQLAHDGFDGIYASVYANPNGAPGPPHYDLIRKQNPARLHDLIRRAARYGIKVYAPILYANTSTPENEQGLRRLVRDIVSQFPEIHGYILLTEGFYYKSFFGAGGRGKRDLRDWGRHWTRAVRIATEECHRINPRIEILPWEYNIDFRPGRVALKRYIIGLLPKETIPLLTWENGKEFELDGLHGYLRDYSISQIGPAEVARGQIAEAKSRGMRVYCKVDTFATWQFGTTPYLPCPQQWHRRYDALAKSRIDGTLETWSNGYKPNFIAELRAWSCWSDAPPWDDLLTSTAHRIFGPGSTEKVRTAWKHFSQAIQLVPDTGPSMGTNFAVANPLFFEQPPPRIMLMNHAWWDMKKWGHPITGTKLNPYWPYTHTRMVFYPDFTNRSNRAESYARAWSGIGGIESRAALRKRPVLPVFLKYLNLAADELETGLADYRQAAWAAPPSKRSRALKEVLLVEQMQRMLRSLHAVLEFEDLRFRLAKTTDRQTAGKMLDRMAKILAQEQQRTNGSYETARRDSRLGYECEQDYVYRPYVLGEKLRLLRETLDKQLPAYRTGCGIR